MTKRTVKVYGLVAAAMAGLLATRTAAAKPDSSSIDVGTSFVVEPPMASYIRELDPRELREQVRDWAVLATVARLGASPDQAAAATYELPPARLPYLDELYAFEYGRGRRAYLGSRVLLFRDGEDPDPQTTIGRLADRVRQENGTIPARVEVYLVYDQRDDGRIRVERGDDIAGTELFSQAYGYVEASADSVAELDAWLARVDDLTVAQLRGDHLILGGRQFARTRTANVTSEDVAALYHGHERLEGRRVAARAAIQALPRAAQQTTARVIDLVKAGKHGAAVDAMLHLPVQFPSISRAQLSNAWDAIGEIAASRRGPGFSLDPEWVADPVSPGLPLIATRMQALAAHPCAEIEAIVKRAPELVQSEPDEEHYTSPTRAALRLRESVSAVTNQRGWTAACQALDVLVPETGRTVPALDPAAPQNWTTAVASYYELESRWLAMARTDPRSDLIMVMVQALNYYGAETQTQCARYEETAGTGIGMTMFYTDLLAKLWMIIDHGLSAPTLDVPGFVAEPRLEQAMQLAALGQSHSTRVWFGPRGEAVSRATAPEKVILFDHRFARIYAAGSDPAHPGIETRPNDTSRHAIGWWDRHYDDVADYEQEFHRLNQIMKWSLVTGALSETTAGQYLREMQFPGDLDFAGWLRSNQHRLRYAGSLPVSDTVIPGKECLPIFESYAAPGFSDGYTGGVSTASRESTLRVPAVNTAKPLGGRKAPPTDLGGGAAGTASRAAPRRSGRSVVFDQAKGVPTRDGSGNVALGTPRMTFKPGARPGPLEIVAGDPARPIGVATTERHGNQLKMSWRDGAVEQARHHESTPRTLAEADRAARSGNVLGAARVFEAAPPTGPATTVLDRARAIVVEAAHRRPKAVRDSLVRVADSGEQLSTAAQEMLSEAVQAVGTPNVADHVEYALAHHLPLSNERGQLVVERGAIILTRDVTELETTAAAIPPATDLSERGIFLERQLRLSQDGTLPDLGGQAARWQHRPNVRMAELRQDPAGHPSDEVVETATGAKFDYIAPRTPSLTGSMRPPIVIRKCDSNHQTPQTSDDC